MNRALAFTSRAATDIEEAYSWYEGQRAGLGADFQSPPFGDSLPFAQRSTNTFTLRAPDR